MNSTKQTSRERFKQIAWLFCLVLIVRVCTGLAGWSTLQEDPDSYARLAVGLADHSVYGFASGDASINPTAYRPPLYPWLLSWFIVDSELQPVGVFLFHLALSIATALGTYSLAARLELRWPWLAGMLVTVDPLLIRAGQQVMTELWATFLAVCAWWLWIVIWPKHSVVEGYCPTTKRSVIQWTALYLLGIFLGLSILTRPTAAPWAILCSLGMIGYGCSCWKRRMSDTFIVTSGVLLCVLPWTLRNMKELGRPIWSTTHGGYTLFLANNPSLYKHFSDRGPSRDWNAESFHDAWANRGIAGTDTLQDKDYWLREQDNSTASVGSEFRRVHSLGELVDDELAYDLALQSIQGDPRTFVLSCFYRLGWLWAWWPSGVGSLTTIVVGTWYGAVLVLAAQGFIKLFCRSRKSEAKCTTTISKNIGHWLPGIALVIVLSTVHCVFWSNMRMRAPAMPCIYLLVLASLSKQGEGKRSQES